MLVPTVIGALRRFIPQWLQTHPPLSSAQRRALWAITHCRTAALGGNAFECERCARVHFAYHSCNHKACPQCGGQATARWIQRELAKRVRAPYFLVTFTLPAQLRGEFFGPLAREAYDLFFAAVSGALSEKLATDKGLRASVSGFTAVLHTWNQRLEFHPHIHCLVPGAGLNRRGRPVRVKKANFLVYLPHLQRAFRQRMGQLLQEKHWPVDPAVWNTSWGVHIQPVGAGVAALKYLGTYVARTAITDARLCELTDSEVTFQWTDRSDHHRRKSLSLPGVEFVRRYWRHVLPRGLRAVRYYGFCHPAAKARRLRLQLLTAMPVELGAPLSVTSFPIPKPGPPCPSCGASTHWVAHLPSPYRQRGPPMPTRPAATAA